jgi:hypothetical protein
MALSDELFVKIEQTISELNIWIILMKNGKNVVIGKTCVVRFPFC